MAEVVTHVRLWRHLAAAQIRSQLQYPVSFALDLVAGAAGPFLDFVAILFIFNQLPRLGDWSLAEVAFLYATSSLSFSFCDLVVGHLDRFNLVIRDGSFDSILIRPVGSLFQVVTSDFQLRRLGKAVQSIGVLVYALISLDIDWTFAKLVVMVAMVVGGSVIFASIWIAGAAVCFWTVDTIEVNNALTYGGNYLTTYPLGIYARAGCNACSPSASGWRSSTTTRACTSSDATTCWVCRRARASRSHWPRSSWSS